MPWFKLAGEGAFHAKVIEAGNEAYGAWCRAGQWTSQHLTEGRIPRATALLIAPAKVWARLVDAKAGREAGLAVAIDDGWEIHDYLQWNPDAEEVAERRRARSEAGRKGGRASGKSREAKPKQARSKNEATPQANGFATVEAKTNPVSVGEKREGDPDPDPPLPPSSSSPRRDPDPDPAPGGETWQAIAERCAPDNTLAASFGDQLAGGRPLTKVQRKVLLDIDAKLGGPIPPTDLDAPLTIHAAPPPSGLDTSPDAVAAARAQLDRVLASRRVTQ